MAPVHAETTQQVIPGTHGPFLGSLQLSMISFTFNSDSGGGGGTPGNSGEDAPAPLDIAFDLAKEMICSPRVRNTVAGVVGGVVATGIATGFNPGAMAMGGLTGGTVAFLLTDTGPGEQMAITAGFGGAEGMIEGPRGAGGGLVGGLVGGAMSSQGASNTLSMTVAGATTGAIAAGANTAFRPFNRLAGGARAGWAGFFGGLSADAVLGAFSFACK